jgi:Fic family protein
MIPLTELNFDNAVNYHYDQLPPVRLDYQQLLVPATRATDAVARFDQMLKNMHNSEFLIAPLRNQEAVLSSRMEGTISTMDEILQYEAEYGEDGEDGKFKTRSEVIETLLYQRALRYAQHLIEQEGYPLSDWLIRGLHQKLLSFGRGADKTPGSYKTEQNYLVDKTKRNVLFIPTSPEKLRDGLSTLFNYMANSQEQILIKTALSHVEFEALHPFKDGNGRIGRMLITLMLSESKVIAAPHFYISGYFEENKDLYIDLMRNVSRTGDWTSWTLFFLEAVEHQAIHNLHMAESIKNLYDEMKNVFSEKLASRYHDKALDFVFTNPIFRNNKFTSAAGIPTSTAHSFTKTLLDEGLIITVQPPSGRRPAIYAFEPLMKLIRV